MEYLFQENLDNKVHDITYKEIRKMYYDNLREAKEAQKMTESSYRGENFYNSGIDQNLALYQEYLIRDFRTSGMRMYYPHGVVVQQAARRNYYRGENQIYNESVPTLLRTLKRYNTVEEKELYRLVSDMRIAEFKYLIYKFQHVINWKYSDVLDEAIAQHYGLETSWLDITNDFNVALFFATCYWENGQWKPLTREQTEVDENHQYGMIFHMPSNRMPLRWTSAIPKFMPWTDVVVGKTPDGNDKYEKLDYPIYRGELENLIYPLGFQPFMRCHMQNGYGIYMRTPQSLQTDNAFEKLKFRHSERLSKDVYELMQGGELIYPHEGLKKIEYIIDKIKCATSFSEDAFYDALYRNHYFKLSDSNMVKQKLRSFEVNGKYIEITKDHPWKLSAARRKAVDNEYQDFSVEQWYGIHVLDRQKIPSPNPMFEPWMMPEENDGEGVKDFRIRKSVECGHGIVEIDLFNLLYTLEMAQTPDF